MLLNGYVSASSWFSGRRLQSGPGRSPPKPASEKFEPSLTTVTADSNYTTDMLNFFVGVSVFVLVSADYLL